MAREDCGRASSRSLPEKIDNTPFRFQLAGVGGMVAWVGYMVFGYPYEIPLLVRPRIFDTAPASSWAVILVLLSPAVIGLGLYAGYVFHMFIGGEASAE